MHTDNEKMKEMAKNLTYKIALCATLSHIDTICHIRPIPHTISQEKTLQKGLYIKFFI